MTDAEQRFRKSITVSELSFLTAVRTANRIGKQEGLSKMFARR